MLLSQMGKQSQFTKNNYFLCKVMRTTCVLITKPTRAFRCYGTELGEVYDGLESGDKGCGAMMSEAEKGIRRILSPGGN